MRGPLVARAGEIEKELKSGAKKPFKEVIKANIGDCHAMGQRPMTFLRQILACSAFPKLLESDDYPCDVKERVKAVLGDCKGGSVGSYTDSPGIEVIRKQAAKYIEKRDCVPANYEDIFLTTGASDGIKHIMLMLIHSIEGNDNLSCYYILFDNDTNNPIDKHTILVGYKPMTTLLQLVASGNCRLHLMSCFVHRL